MKTMPNIFVFVRWLLAMVFIISGAQKLVSPVENFILVLHRYALVQDPDLVMIMAWTIPWIEFLTGIFLALGLWTELALIASGSVGVGSLIFIGQAITRELSLVNCGCLGDLFQFPLKVTFALQWVIIALSIGLYLNIQRTNRFSLDRALSD